MAKIYQPITQVTGTVGIIPSFRYTAFGDDLATVTSPGYLNVNNLDGISLSTNDIIEAFYSYNPLTLNGTLAQFSVGITNGVITLTQIGSGGGTGSGTVNAGTANQLAYYNASGTAVSGLATANSGVLVTSSTGVPSIATTLPVTSGGTGVTAVPSKGQLLIGNDEGFTLTGLNAGNLIQITNGTGSIQIASSAIDSISISTDAGNSIVSEEFTISGAATGLTTASEGTNINLTGVLNIASGGTGVTSFPLPVSAIPVNGTSIVSTFSYENGLTLTPSTSAQNQTTPLYEIANVTYFAVAGQPNLIVYSFDGSSATVVQTIYAESDSNWFYGVVNYTLAGVDYLATIIFRNGTPSSSTLRVYSWNGTAYVQVGTDLNYPSSGFSSIVYFVIAGTSYVAVTDTNNNLIYLFSWNGTAYVQVGSPIATPEASADTGIIFYAIGTDYYLTISDYFRGISTYRWNSTTFVEISDQPIAGGEYSVLSFFPSNGSYYLAATSGTGSSVKIFEWDGTSSYTVIQTITTASATYGFSLATYAIGSDLYMSVTKVLGGVYSVDSYIWDASLALFSFVKSQVLPNSTGYGMSFSFYNNNPYLLISSAGNFFYIYELSLKIAAGLIPVANGGTGITTLPTDGKLLIGNTAGGYTSANITAGSNISITNGNGSITIAAASGSGGIVTLNANSGSATGSSVTIGGGTTGLTTTASETNLALAGVLSVANGGTGVTSFPLPVSAIPIDNATIVSGVGGDYQDYLQLTPDTENQRQVTPIYTIAGTSYFAVAGQPNLIVYSFDGSSATVVQTIYSGNDSWLFSSVVKYSIAGVEYISVSVIKDTSPILSSLLTYSWNGTAYVQVDDVTYALSAFSQIVYFAIAGTSYIALTDTPNNEIILFAWNGTAYLQSGSRIATQSDSEATAIIYYTIDSVSYLTVSNQSKGISTYSWNGTTFVQASAQTIADAAFSNLSFFTEGANHYIVGTSANYLMLLQWNPSTTNYTAIQTIAGSFGYGITTFVFSGTTYMNATLDDAGSYYVATYAWNGTNFKFSTQELLSNNVDTALTASAYESGTYILIGTKSNFFDIYKFAEVALIEAGLIPVANGGTGLTAAPANGQLLIGNGTGYALGTLTAGSNVTITNTAGSISIAAATTSGSLINVQYLTAASGTYTKTAGTNKILVQCIAAGGGAGGTFVSTGAASSGGAGGGAFAQKFYATAPATATYTVGQFGAGGIGNANGSAGGETTFTPSTGGNMAVTGGSGTFFATSTAGAAILTGGTGGVAGAGDTSDFVLPGSNGGAGVQISTIVRMAGDGGSSGIGSGGAIGSVNGSTSNGRDATGYGGGGSGSTAIIGLGTGGDGANGLIVVFEYS